MDSGCNCQSHQRGPAGYWAYYPSGTGAMASGNYANPAHPPIISYEHPPWNSSYGYMYPPVSCHGSVPREFAWRPAYPHPPYEPCTHTGPVSYPGFFPYPMQYEAPAPPIYTMQQPWYEAQKKTSSDHHCCGCPSSQCRQANVKIVEEETDGEGRKNNPVNSFQGQNDDGSRGFPFPLVCVPCETEREEDKTLKLGCADPETGKEDPKVAVVDKKKISSGGQKCSKIKEIPVKDKLQQYQDKEIQVMKENGGEVGDASSTEATKISEVSGPKCDNNKKPYQSSSKLPPICLRVDPLPRKKSRSPSPPAKNQKADGLQPNETVDVRASSDNEAQTNISSTINNQDSRSVKKTIQVVDGKKEQDEKTDIPEEGKTADAQCDRGLINKAGSCGFAEPLEIGDRISNKEVKESGVQSCVFAEPVGNVESVNNKEVKEDGAQIFCKRVPTHQEAAVVIQSAYRGFKVRKLEPLKKLKRISEIRDQIAQVKRLIQETESCNDADEGVSKRNKFISERIMSLLLELDTIQGLHPSVREVRKSVVTELVTLQEKLDSINKVAEASPDMMITSQGEESLERSIHPASPQRTDHPECLSGDVLTPDCEPIKAAAEENVGKDLVDMHDENSVEEKMEEHCGQVDGENSELPEVPADVLPIDLASSSTQPLHGDPGETCWGGNDATDELKLPPETDTESCLVKSLFISEEEGSCKHSDEEAPDTVVESLHEEGDVYQTTFPSDGDHSEPLWQEQDAEPRNAAAQVKTGENILTQKGRQAPPPHLPASDKNEKVMEENKELGEMMEALIRAGEKHLTAISNLSDRVQDLEKKLSRKRRLKIKQQCRAARSRAPSDHASHNGLAV